MKLLSILIPTTPDRMPLYDRLIGELNRQITDLKLEDQVEIKSLLTAASCSDPSNLELTTGYKRNRLVESCDGKYYAFIDSDDLPSHNYLELIMPGIYKDVDCCSLVGQIYLSGKKGKPFLHSIKYKEWFEDDQFYYRSINHLNVVKKELVQHIKFPETNFGEDGNQSYAMRDAGVLKNEYEINEVLYHYHVGFPKHCIECA